MKITNIVIIGSGNRVQNTILPALFVLKKSFRIKDIYSRSIKILKAQGDNKKHKTKIDIENIDFKDVDILIISISPSSVPKVLETLPKKHLSKIVLFVDTPVLEVGDIGSAKYFKQFKKVLVLEDYISMSHFNRISKLINSRALGGLKKIYLFHSGFRYHAIAILKKLTGQKYIRKIKKIIVGGGVNEIRISFWNGMGCVILEPRNYLVGRFLVVFDHGTISDYDLGGQNSIVLNYLKSNGLGCGYEMKGLVNYKYSFFDKKIPREVYKKFRDNSLTNFMKIDALVVMIGNYNKRDYNYCYDESLYDNMLTTVLDKFGIVYDFPLPLFKKSFISSLIYLKGLL